MTDEETSRELSGKRILFVEDDEISSYAVAKMLTSAGCELVSCPDYRGALDEIESDRNIDLLITDIKLPAGTPHGISLAQMARERRRKLPLLFITAFEEFVPLAENMGDVLLKPVDCEVLIRGIQEACNQRESDVSSDAR